MECVRYPQVPLRVAQRAIFSLFEYKSTADRLRRCQLKLAGQCHKQLMVGGNIDHTDRRQMYVATNRL